MCNTCSEPKFSDYHSENIYTWCTNCGNYGIAAAMKRALVTQGLNPHEVLLCFDIGCHGNGSDKIDGYRIHGLHGRVLPFAAGATLANNHVKVIAFGGDGGTLSEGMNHFVHSIRSDYNMVFVLHNNYNYGLTKGQASVTTPNDLAMNSTPDGRPSDRLNVMEFALSLNPSFAARTFSGDVKQMAAIFQEAIKHKGFAFVEVLQSCPTYNKATPHTWYMERIFDTLELKDYDNTNLAAAKAIAEDIEEKIATGILYKRPNTDFYNRLVQRKTLTTELVDEVTEGNILKLKDKFR